jgi:hypothetical protein
MVKAGQKFRCEEFIGAFKEHPITIEIEDRLTV